MIDPDHGVSFVALVAPAGAIDSDALVFLGIIHGTRMGVLVWGKRGRWSYRTGETQAGLGARAVGSAEGRSGVPQRIFEIPPSVASALRCRRFGVERGESGGDCGGMERQRVGRQLCEGGLLRQAHPAPLCRFGVRLQTGALEVAGQGGVEFGEVPDTEGDRGGSVPGAETALEGGDFRRTGRVFRILSGVGREEERIAEVDRLIEASREFGSRDDFLGGVCFWECQKKERFVGGNVGGFGGVGEDVVRVHIYSKGFRHRFPG